MLEAMFVACLQPLLLDMSASANQSMASSFDRRRLFDALESNDAHTIETILQQSPASRGSTPSSSAATRPRARELEAIAAFQAWTEQEGRGRTELTRKQAAELKHQLRAWFSNLKIEVTDTTVRFHARRKATRDTPTMSNEATIDLREWQRSLPLAHRTSHRYRTWTRAEILGALQAWADRHGRPPRMCDIEQQREGCPSARTILVNFGTWYTVLDEAGLTSRNTDQTPAANLLSLRDEPTSAVVAIGHFKRTSRLTIQPIS